jgi:hypothetical protein
MLNFVFGKWVRPRKRCENNIKMHIIVRDNLVDRCQCFGEAS